MNKSTKRGFWIVVTVVAVAIMAGVLSLQVKPAGASVGYDHVIDVWERAWNEILQYTPAGQYYEALFAKHSDEVQALTGHDPVHVMRLWQVAERFVPGMEALLDGKGDTVQITEEQVHALNDELDWLASAGSPSLRTDIETELQRFPLEQFVGMTVNEALDYVNANVPPIISVEPTATPIAEVTTTPRPASTDQCVAGYDPDCLAEPTLVPGTEGRWAYYVLSGIYFEYPSKWRVEQWNGRTDILTLVPTPESPEGSQVDEISIFAGNYPDSPDVPQYDPLTYPQTVWLRPTPLWNRLVSLPDLTGSEFLWTDEWNKPLMFVEAIFYDPATKIALGVLMIFSEDPADESLHDPDLVQEQYPNFRHILESFRIGKP